MNTEKTEGSVAIVFDIQRFSIHDGPGIRTLIFFKGCSLNCAWCQNPESIQMKPEMAFYVERCIGCGNCVGVCPEGALSMESARRIAWDKCTACGQCARECPANALQIIGTSYSVNGLVRESLRDKDFFDVSGGGISLSGGEPVLQHTFLLSFLPQLRKCGVDILLETAGNYPFPMLEPLLPFLDRIYFDYKLPGDGAYRKHTGSGCGNILNVLQSLLDRQFPITVRTPVLPGINTHPDQIAMMADTLHALGITDVHLLRYNRLWEAKIPRLNTGQKELQLDADRINYDEVLERFAACDIKATLFE